jgi:hypothetical protein
MDLGDIVPVRCHCARGRGSRWCRILGESTCPSVQPGTPAWQLTYSSRNASNRCARVSPVVSTTLGMSAPGTLLVLATTSSSAKPASLCTPGVLTEGGPRGPREDDRGCRLDRIDGACDGASLRGSRGVGAPSEGKCPSTVDDMIVQMLVSN